MLEMSSGSTISRLRNYQPLMAAYNGSQKTDMKIEGELGKKRHTENRRNRKDNGVTIIVRH